jgi:hypothetical protein
VVRRLAAALVLAVVIAVPAAASTGSVVQGDAQIGAFKTRTGLLKDARAAFGKPLRVKKKDASSCLAVWSNGVAATFLDLAQKDPCGRGVFVQGTMIGRAWRTAAGLRIGDPVARVARLHPHAKLHHGSGPTAGWWLVTRHACELGGYAPFPGLLARVSRGRISAFVVQLGVCE